MVSVCCIIGGSSGVLDDYQAACRLQQSHDVIVINDMIAEFPGRIKCAASLHNSKISGWLNQRQYRKYNAPAAVYCIGRAQGVTNILHDTWHGSSGLYAVRVGLELGYNKIILCGIPMHLEDHFLRKRPWQACKNFRPAWVKHRSQFIDKVRSASGWTQEMFGAPTQEWLDA